MFSLFWSGDRIGVKTSIDGMGLTLRAHWRGYVASGLCWIVFGLPDDWEG